MCSWTLQKDPRLTLIQFVGDEKLSVDRPHGNSKNEQRPYVRSAPSVIRRQEGTTRTPQLAYNEEAVSAATDTSNQLLRTCRNTKQIKNAQQNLRRLYRITHDSFVSLSLLDLEYEDVRLLLTVPDLIFMYIHPELLQQVNKLLDIPYFESHFKQLVGYDTQVNKIYLR